MTASLSAPNAFGRLARKTPVVGRVIREVERETDSVYYLLIIFLTAVVLAVKAWGIPALVLTALLLVPVMFVLFILITKP
jgi:uncharacterized membrane protein